MKIVRCICLSGIILIITCVMAKAQDIETSTFSFKGNGGISVHNTCLYKIDNQTRANFTSGYLGFGYNKTHKFGAFDISLAPGKHSFELVFNDKERAKKPTKIVVKKITIDMLAGCEYEMEKNDFDLSVTCKSKEGSKAANYTIEDIETLEDPTENFATIIYIPEEKSEIHPLISRIDDKITANQGDISETCNSMVPVDFKFFSGKNGALNMKIPAGTHKVEYILLGELVYDGIVQIDTISFESDKTYQVKVEEIKEKREKHYSVSFVEQ